MAVTMRVRNIDALTERMALGYTKAHIRMRVIVRGPAAAYSRIWEFGRVDCQPGPKTEYNTNPDGETRVMTITAPHGFVRVNKLRYREIIKEEMRKVKFSKLKPSQWNPAMQMVFDKAAKRCAELISETAPYDTYALQTAIVARTADDTTPLTTDRSSFKTGIKAK